MSRAVYGGRLGGAVIANSCELVSIRSNVLRVKSLASFFFFLSLFCWGLCGMDENSNICRDADRHGRVFRITFVRRTITKYG